MCTRRVAPDLCTQGYYCPAGTGYNKLACPSGTFGGREGLVEITECSNCTAGSYCQGNGLSKPSGVCDPRYWCLTGINTKAPVSGSHTGTGGQCFPGHECPSNTSYPVPCEKGTYSSSQGASNCLQCPAGSLLFLFILLSSNPLKFL